MPDDWFEKQLKRAVSDAQKLDQWMQIRRDEASGDETTNESSDCSNESDNSSSNDRSSTELNLR